jgi:hypothetical protein
MAHPMTEHFLELDTMRVFINQYCKDNGWKKPPRARQYYARSIPYIGRYIVRFNFKGFRDSKSLRPLVGELRREYGADYEIVGFTDEIVLILKEVAK